MAEARMAARPMPAFWHAGYDVDTKVPYMQMNATSQGLVLFIPHPRLLLRRLRRFFWRTLYKINEACMPLPAWSVIASSAAVAFWVARSPRSAWQRSGWLATKVWDMDSKLPFTHLIPTNVRISYLSAEVTTAALLAFTASQRFLLRRLLSYTGWLHEARGKVSLKTKVWGTLLRYIYIRGGRRRLFFFQSALPSLPVPRVENTVARYMLSVKPLVSEVEYAEIEEMKDQFLTGEAPRLQRYLYANYLIKENYVSDWWLNFVYLRGRDSLCINANYYGLCYAAENTSSNQVAKAAFYIYQLAKIKRSIDREEFPALCINNAVPMCMKQYYSSLSTTRIPMGDQDQLLKVDDRESAYVVVTYKGRFYRLPVFTHSFNQLSPYQLEKSIQGIVSHEETPADEYDTAVAALTGLERNRWAQVREEMLMTNPVNRKALHTVEKAMFHVSLDDYCEKEAFNGDYSKEAAQCLHGNGINRWFDKSFTLVVRPDGRVGMNCEHAWGDAPVTAHYVELLRLGEERWPGKLYDANGHIHPTEDDIRKEKAGKLPFPPAVRLLFHVTPQLREVIAQEALPGIKKSISDLQLRVHVFEDYGRGMSKKCGCSPDAWVQMALQIAYFRDKGEFAQTYEASMTRLFAGGRTETIRTVTEESCAFVRALEDKATDRKEVVKLLQKACSNHQELSHAAMSGNGCDRHLFALYVVAMYLNVESEFLASVFDRKFLLSTSQVPQRQTPPNSWPGNDQGDRWYAPSGGFGPVTDEGYGISYVFAGEGRIFVHVSSKISCPTTSAERMINHVFSALRDIRNLFPDVPDQPPKFPSVYSS